MRKIWIALLGAGLLIGSWGGAGRAASVFTHANSAAGIKGCTGKGTVSFMFYGDAGGKHAQEVGYKLAEKACPGLHVIPDWHQGDYDTALPKLIGSGHAPDVFIADSAKYIPAFASQGALYPLDSFVKRDHVNLKKIFVSKCVPGMYYKGHLYGMMQTCGNQKILYYNKDMFDAKKLKYPTEAWTYKDFAKAAVKLSGTYGYKSDPASKERFGYAWNQDDYMFQSYMWQWGGAWTSQNGKQCLLTQPASRAGLKWWNDLRYKLHGSPTASQAGPLGDYYNGFKNGNYAMTFAGAWALNYMFGKSPGSTVTPVPFKWGATLYPKGPKNRQGLLAASGIVVSKTAKNKNAAYWLARYLAEGPGAAIIGSYGIDTPGAVKYYKDARVKKEYGSLLGIALKANNTGRVPVVVARYPEYRDATQKALDPFWKNTMSVEQATTNACRDAAPFLDK